MQYGNPYFAQPFQQIQPYQDRLAQLQNSYQQAMPYGQAQIQQPIQQMPQVPQIPMLQGQMVDGIDTVKARSPDMANPMIDTMRIVDTIMILRILNPREKWMIP